MDYKYNNVNKWMLSQISIFYFIRFCKESIMASPGYHKITQAITSGKFDIIKKELENGFNANTGPEVSFF